MIYKVSRRNNNNRLTSVGVGEIPAWGPTSTNVNRAGSNLTDGAHRH